MKVNTLKKSNMNIKHFSSKLYYNIKFTQHIPTNNHNPFLPFDPLE